MNCGRLPVFIYEIPSHVAERSELINADVLIVLMAGTLVLLKKKMFKQLL